MGRVRAGEWLLTWGGGGEGLEGEQIANWLLAEWR